MLRGEHRQLAQDEQEAFLDQHANDALTRPAGVRSRAVYAMRNQCRSHVQLIEADNKLAASGAVLLAYGAHVARHTASVHSQPGLSPFAKVDPSTLISTVVRPRSARRSAAVRDQLAAQPLTDQVGPARPRSHGTNRPAPRVR